MSLQLVSQNTSCPLTNSIQHLI
uniref:Uncharacterized protein n=1 Tax=Rhizophora mucronata TaxID=61149 RepID=A0A2P2IV61_RHIMU